MMSKYFVCCEKCFNDIAYRRTDAAKFWMDLCKVCLDYKSNFILISDVFEIRDLIQLLEIMGFLVSTDRDDEIAIRLNKYINTMDGEPFFCCKGGFHGEE